MCEIRRIFECINLKIFTFTLFFHPKRVLCKLSAAVISSEAAKEKININKENKKETGES